MINMLLNGAKNLKYIEEFSANTSVINNLDARSKLFVAVAFVIAVSFTKREDLVCIILLGAYPCFLASGSGYHIKYLFSQMMLILPFVFFLGFSEVAWKLLFLPHSSLSVVWEIILFIGLILRFVILFVTLIITFASIPFATLGRTLTWFKFPAAFVTLLLFVYRFIFILFAEIEKLFSAVSIRLPYLKSLSFKMYVDILGGLLIKTVHRARRVQDAYMIRTNGDLMSFDYEHKMQRIDWFYLGLALGYLLLVKII